ncbi:hypothetical protein [Streptomyces sp. SID3343]|uniref:hypothetical protein n=1 Tax=Streptomyces sp. SID3343 TaxID=2690260 RepID=UPI001368C01E|nr:hypothetical protein [Streptomyces sp. SID3343]MYW03339.1 hypothetical protein [Streptomyces sp. SID3343]MYW06255.1 hypothetical protein [Streptomyces sp. SID3343]
MTDIVRTDLPAPGAAGHVHVTPPNPCSHHCVCDRAVDHDLAWLIGDLAGDLAFVRTALGPTGTLTARLLDERGVLLDLPVHLGAIVAWRLQRAFPGIAWDLPHDFHPATARLTAATARGC